MSTGSYERNADSSAALRNDKQRALRNDGLAALRDDNQMALRDDWQEELGNSRQGVLRNDGQEGNATRSVALLVLVWLVLQIGGMFRPGLLDDVDSVYLEIAREMLQRHDYVTPTIDGVRFFDKPPLMYWMAAGRCGCLASTTGRDGCRWP